MDVKKSFETCWDDDQIEISDWISDQLYKNPDGFYKVTVEVKEIHEER